MPHRARRIVPLFAALCVALTAACSSSPVAVAVEEEQPFDSVNTNCYADTVVVNGQVRLICPSTRPNP